VICFISTEKIFLTYRFDALYSAFQLQTQKIDWSQSQNFKFLGQKKVALVMIEREPQNVDQASTPQIIGIEL